jgi:hypothetical protein
MSFGRTSRPEPTSSSVAVFVAGPMQDAVFEGWSSPLVDVLAIDLLR